MGRNLVPRACRDRILPALGIAAVVWLFFAAGVMSATAAELSQAELTDRAIAFMRAVGAADAEVEPMTVGVDPGRSNATMFDYSSGARISVERESGRVVSFFDPQAITHDDTGKRLTNEEAKAAAMGHLQAAGVSLQDAVFKNTTQAVEVNAGGPPMVLQARWGRVYQGYPVLGDDVNVSVDGQTGRLVGFGDWFVSKMPAEVTPQVTKDQAEAKARQLAGRDTTWTAKLVIVPLRGVVRGRYSPDRYGAETRLAWYVLPADTGSQFFIDAVNGEELGRTGGARGMAGQPDTAAIAAGRGVVFPEGGTQPPLERLFPYIGGAIAALLGAAALVIGRSLSHKRRRLAQSENAYPSAAQSSVPDLEGGEARD